MSATVAFFIFFVPFLFRNALFPAHFSFGWDLWIEQKPVASISTARRNLQESASDARAFLASRGVARDAISLDDVRIQDLRKSLWVTGKRLPFEASQRLHVDANDYRKFANISNDVVRARDRHPDWSSSFPPLTSEWLLVLAFMTTAAILVCTAYVLASAEIGRTYSATLPPNLDGDYNKSLGQSKFMSPGFIFVQTVSIGSTALLALCYARMDASAARMVFAGMAGAQIVLVAYWLIRTRGYWSDVFLKGAYIAYLAAVAAITAGFLAALRSV